MSTPFVSAMQQYLPANVLTADEVDEWVGEASGWTKKTTGVETRHVAEDSETVAGMGATVVRNLMAAQGMTFADVDALVFAAGSKDQFLPASAALVAHELGPEATGIPAFDIDATCLSFVLALDLMSRALTTGMFERIVLVTAEMPTRSLNPDYKEAAALFGDAAIAAVLQVGDPDPEAPAPIISRVLHSKFATFGEGAHYSEVKIGASYNPNTDFHDYNPDDFTFMMEGPKIYELASRRLPCFIEEFLVEAKLSFDDFDFVIPHQASKPAVELLARKFKVPVGNYAQDYRRYGNTVAASIPLSLLMAQREGRITRGDRVLFVGAAAGLTLGAMAIEV